MTRRLEGKVAIVCGAGASGGGISIGTATAITLAREGAKVFAVDRDIALAELARTEIEKAGGTCALHQCDIADAASVAAMVAACRETFGGVDILFNNVGLFLGGGPEETSEDDFDRLMTVNVKGMFLTVKSVLPEMLRRGGGSIVNNASICAIRYQMPSMAYSVSKAGVLQITQNVGVQYAAKGIRCNAVLPGNILTDRFVARVKSVVGDGYEAEVRKWGDQVPSGLAGEPWDVANAVLFLASDEAKYINATQIVIDGGLSASVVGHAI
ncbi:MAG: SDR family oxidoreductase [Rhodobiaceae bacterium]|nr:SDR family oxidoreductase [Rhodobiaceae bacterium]